MKLAVIALLALVVICSAQTPRPIPLPSLNLNKIAGTWYAVVGYPNTNFAPITCYTMDFTPLSDTQVKLSFSVSVAGQKYSDTVTISVSHNGSVWTSQDSSVTDWISFDPVSGAWATFAKDNEQSAMIISRSPTLSNTIIQSQLALLQSEGYNANSNNTMIIPSTQC